MTTPAALLSETFYTLQTNYIAALSSLVSDINVAIAEVIAGRLGGATLDATMQSLQTQINALGAGSTFTGTSATSTLIATGSKTFAVNESGRSWAIGTTLILASAANPANSMTGQVTAYAANSLTVNVTAVGGAGTFADWQIGFSSGTSVFTALGVGGAAALSQINVNAAGTALAAVPIADGQWARRNGAAMLAVSETDEPMFYFMRGR